MNLTDSKEDNLSKGKHNGDSYKSQDHKSSKSRESRLDLERDSERYYSRSSERRRYSREHERYDRHSKGHRSRSRESKRIKNGEAKMENSNEEQNLRDKPLKSILKKESSIKPVPLEEEISLEFLDEDPEERENRLIEEKRRRRQAILEKHRYLKDEMNNSSPIASTSEVEASTSYNSPLDVSKHIESDGFLTGKLKYNSKVSSPNAEIPVPTEIDATVMKENSDQLDFIKTHPEEANIINNTKISDPLADNKEAENEDDFDMFGDEIPSPTFKIDKLVAPSAPVHTLGLQDQWDDEEGYYKVTIGELIDGRYQIYNTLGKGVFSTVVKAKDTLDGNREVAIKIIRCNETMHRLGLKEIEILKKLAENDPHDKKHVIRILGHFEYRKHLCVVFESLSLNLREVLKKYGKDVGISIQAVRAYAKQLFLALLLLDRTKVIHADIKPDNILVSENHNLLKLCDLGSASYTNENEITPYLVSRYYRAPEIILGLSYDTAVDVWSVACTLFEMYTGKILFPGRDNNHMLKLMMDLKGRFPNKMVKKGKFADRHFDTDFGFLYMDKEAGCIKTINVGNQPTKELKGRIMKVTNSNDEATLKLTTSFISFLEKCLNLNPELRLTVRDALEHPFLK